MLGLVVILLLSVMVLSFSYVQALRREALYAKKYRAAYDEVYETARVEAQKIVDTMRSDAATEWSGQLQSMVDKHLADIRRLSGADLIVKVSDESWKIPMAKFWKDPDEFPIESVLERKVIEFRPVALRLLVATRGPVEFYAPKRVEAPKEKK